MPMRVGMDGLIVLVVADNLAVAQDLNLTVRRFPSVTVLGPAFDDEAACQAIAVERVDVIVVDLDRSDGLGPELIQRLRTGSTVPVLATSHTPDAATASVVLAAGGSGLLPLDAEHRYKVAILRSAAAGEIALPDDHLSSVVEHLQAARATHRREAIATLTARELEVLTLLCDGRTVGEMAGELGVSGSTVQAHIKAVFAKLGVHSQVEAVRAAWRLGLVAPISA